MGRYVAGSEWFGGGSGKLKAHVVQLATYNKVAVCHAKAR